MYDSVFYSVHVGAAVLTSFVAAAREKLPVGKTVSVTMRNVATWRTVAMWLVDCSFRAKIALFTLWMANS